MPDAFRAVRRVRVSRQMPLYFTCCSQHEFFGGSLVQPGLPVGPVMQVR